MEYAELSNGMKMPMLGYGVFQIDDETTERCVADALAAGYRLIDTAQAYMNERGVGAAIAKGGVAREDIFLVDKVWVSNYGEGKTYESIRQSLELLGLDYIDMMLLHQPYNDYYGAWRDMERAPSHFGNGSYRKGGKEEAVSQGPGRAGRVRDALAYAPQPHSRVQRGRRIRGRGDGDGRAPLHRRVPR